MVFQTNFLFLTVFSNPYICVAVHRGTHSNLQASLSHDKHRLSYLYDLLFRIPHFRNKSKNTRYRFTNLRKILNHSKHFQWIMPVFFIDKCETDRHNADPFVHAATTFIRLARTFCVLHQNLFLFFLYFVHFAHIHIALAR